MAPFPAISAAIGSWTFLAADEIEGIFLEFGGRS
jgi:hypothetical protein